MDVGIFLDLRNPPEWRVNSSRLYNFTLEMCEEAERLGAASVWTSEHHLFEDGYLTQPVTFLAAVAARTKKVKLGTAITVAPLHQAPRLAEDSALIDLISNGRMNLGLGAGYRIPEYELYGADISARFKTTDARALAVRDLMKKLTPEPVQNPFPIWLGYQKEKGARRAGRMGFKLLCPDAALWPHYRDGLAEGGHDPSIAHMGGLIWGWLSEDPDAEWPIVKKYYDYQINSYGRYGAEGTGRPYTPVDVEKLRWRGGPINQRSFLIATPEDAAKQIKAFTAGAPVKHIHMFASVGGMPEKMVQKQVELISTRLGPLLKG
jgi:alkanesulfonate monooxygenase SsuD/methylene tetrahydromethanopterin reductase-like flavin-dependent oxidoreductase (luciferase family)